MALPDTKEIIMRSQFEDEILSLIDEQANFTRSDLQGIVGALVIKILEKGKEMGRAEK